MLLPINNNIIGVRYLITLSINKAAAELYFYVLLLISYKY